MWRAHSPPDSTSARSSPWRWPPSPTQTGLAAHTLDAQHLAIASTSTIIWCVGHPNNRPPSPVQAQRLCTTSSSSVVGSVCCSRNFVLLSPQRLLYNAITLAPSSWSLTLPITIDIHFLHEKITLGNVRVLHIPSSHQYLDIMTKWLPVQLFTNFRVSLCIRDPFATTAGGY
jgi:hypothetical protein